LNVPFRHFFFDVLKGSTLCATFQLSKNLRYKQSVKHTNYKTAVMTSPALLGFCTTSHERSIYFMPDAGTVWGVTVAGVSVAGVSFGQSD